MAVSTDSVYRARPRSTKVRRCLIVAALLATGAGVIPSWGDFAEGQRASDAKRYDDALAEWRAAADDGDARAMLALGRLFRAGLGVPQDHVLAHMWFNLAASRGQAEAAEERDALAAKMDPNERAEAQRRAREWRPGSRPEARRIVSNDAPAASSSIAASTADAPPPRAIREAQALLTTLGYNPGSADGTWNEPTLRAYQLFLLDAGIERIAVLTPDVLRQMREIADRHLENRQAPATVMTPAADAVPGTIAPAPPETWRIVLRSEDRRNLLDVAWSESLSLFVAVGASWSGPSANDLVLVSADGDSWTQVGHFALGPLLDVIWSGSEFMAVGSYGAILRSTDGINWYSVSSNTSERLTAVTSSTDSLFVAVGDDSGIHYSADGENWSQTASAEAGFLSDVAWSESLSRFVVVGAGIILHSSDGRNWETATSGDSERLHAVSWSEPMSRFVAVGSEGTIIHSTDGLNWEAASSGTSDWFGDVTWGRAYFVAAARSGNIFYSSDGITWSEAFRTGASGWLNGVTWSGSLSTFVAVGNREIAISP